MTRLTGRDCRLLLIDDDRDFLALMNEVADNLGLPLDCFESLEAMGRLGNLSNYAGALIDFELGVLTGVEIAQYVDAFLAGLPVLIVSGRDAEALGSRWPNCVQGFLSKTLCPSEILLYAAQIAGIDAPGRPTEATLAHVVHTPTHGGLHAGRSTAETRDLEPPPAPRVGVWQG